MKASIACVEVEAKLIKLEVVNIGKLSVTAVITLSPIPNLITFNPSLPLLLFTPTHLPLD